MKIFFLLLLCFALIQAKAYAQVNVVPEISVEMKGALKVAKGNFEGDFTQPTFRNLSDGTGDRDVIVTVSLESCGFSSVPVVHYGIVSLDTWKDSNQRVRVYLVSVTKTAITFRVNTWNTSRVYGIKVDWIAIGN